MPRRPAHPCRVAGCPRLVTSGPYCTEHRQAYEQRRAITRGTKQQRGYGGAWDAMRARVLAEQPICAQCQRALAVEVHHRIPLRLGGTHDRANLVGLCRSCHHTITQARR